MLIGTLTNIVLLKNKIMAAKYVPFKQTASEIQVKMQKLIKKVLNEKMPKDCANLIHLADRTGENLITEKPAAVWLYANGSWSLARWIVKINGVPEGFHLSLIYPVGYGKPYLEERQLWTRDIKDNETIPLGRRTCVYNQGIVREIITE